MFVILVYDVNVSRVGKVLKISRRYLTWVQNSVLEGELTEATLRALRNELARVINPKEDSVLFYILGNEKYAKREIMGIRKGGEGWIF
jgi:CRISPR-associated protein Cas2